MAMILVVEDDVFIRELAIEMIGDWGHNVLSACDVAEALIHLKGSHHIDALFTDVNLKTEVLGGCDVARLAILLRPGPRVFSTPRPPARPDKMHARFAAGTHFLAKPYSEHQLGLSVQSLLAA